MGYSFEYNLFSELVKLTSLFACGWYSSFNKWDAQKLHKKFSCYPAFKTWSGTQMNKTSTKQIFICLFQRTEGKEEPSINDKDSKNKVNLILIVQSYQFYLLLAISVSSTWHGLEEYLFSKEETYISVLYNNKSNHEL